MAMVMIFISQLITGPGLARVVPPKPISDVIAPPKPSPTKPYQHPLAARPSFRIIPGTPSEPVSVYLMAGQSNLVGAALQANLAPDYTAPLAGAYIWGARTEFVPLAPGFDGRYTKFGTELGFGRRIIEHSHEPVYLIKSGLGATTLAEDWSPDGINNSYDRFTQTVDAALKELSTQGIAYDIKGLVWMQGEHDVWTADFAAAYEQNLTQLINAIRTRYDSDLTIAIGLIRGDLPADTRTPLAQVRVAQRRVAAADSRVFLVDTDALGHKTAILQPDGVHYNAAGQVLLGTAFANAFNADTSDSRD